MVIPKFEENDPQDIAGGSDEDKWRKAISDRTSGGTTADQIAANAINSSRNGGGGTFGDPLSASDPWVWRQLPRPTDFPLYGVNPWTQPNLTDAITSYKGMDEGTKASPDQFTGEFLKRHKDEGEKFEQWVIQRAWATTGDAPLDKEGRFDLRSALTWWNWLGGVVAASPGIRDSMTPEMWADSIYQKVGGDDVFGQWAESNGVGTDEDSNPIKTQTNVYRTKANPQVVNAGVDNLARALLGRMASEKEMARYRKTINSFLAKNPTVQTLTTDSTDPDNVKMTSEVKEGASTSDALNVLEMKMRRGSEGMAFNAGKMIEDAMVMMDRGL